MKLLVTFVVVASLHFVAPVLRSQTPTLTSVSTPCAAPVGVNADALDLSAWVLPHSILGRTRMLKDEFRMSGRNKEFYYVIVGTEDQTTIGSKASVTLRNIYGDSTPLGYGLIFHSMTTPLIQGYALLIDTTRQRYRVVHHTPGKEAVIVPWTHSPYIWLGAVPNSLEMVDRGPTTELYINCHLVETVQNTYAYKDGVVGLYVGNAVRIAFRDLKLERLTRPTNVATRMVLDLFNR
jgi:hypothetical protein